MSTGIRSKTRTFLLRIQSALIGPQTLAFLPALILGSYWFGGEGALMFIALVFPAAFAIAGLFSGTGPAWSRPKDRETELALRATAENALGKYLAAEPKTGKTTAAIALALDDFTTLERQYGARAAATILRKTAERLCSLVREDDIVVRLDGPRFAIALGPVRRADLETLIQLTSRLQKAVSEPISIDATRVFTSATVGFCLAARAPSTSGPIMLELAESALETAIACGNGSIRAYSPETTRRIKTRTVVQNEVADALDSGQIRPWFQPQVSTHTGEITGFEALARWEHPELGIIPPAEFLPQIQELGLMERLGEISLSSSLSALRFWENSGYKVPAVAVNFSSQELSNPKLCERLKWELDRYELTPERLCVEIHEDVIAATKDDVIVNNIQGIAELGCKIDLDDFGTSHASIASIRRFSVTRIKIDRSFITRVDRDREQQNMVAAILTMAERLEIESLAEGVETIGEHAILAQLGCGHVQGFSIARPMPFEETEKWIATYRKNLPAAPVVGRKTG